MTRFPGPAERSAVESGRLEFLCLCCGLSCTGWWLARWSEERSSRRGKHETIQASNLGISLPSQGIVLTLESSIDATRCSSKSRRSSCFQWLELNKKVLRLRSCSKLNIVELFVVFWSCNWAPHCATAQYYTRWEDSSLSLCTLQDRQLDLVVVWMMEFVMNFPFRERKATRLSD